MEMGDFYNSLGRGNGNFIVLGKTSGMVEPGKGAFHNPAPRKFLPFVRSDFLRNVNAQTKLLTDIRYKRTPIAGIRTESLNGRIVLFRNVCSEDSGLCIVNIRGMDSNGQ